MNNEPRVGTARTTFRSLDELKAKIAIVESILLEYKRKLEESDPLLFSVIKLLYYNEYNKEDVTEYDKLIEELMTESEALAESGKNDDDTKARKLEVRNKVNEIMDAKQAFIDSLPVDINTVDHALAKTPTEIRDKADEVMLEIKAKVEKALSPQVGNN